MSLGKILLVDDDAVVRIVVTKILEDNDFEVTAACNVTEALRHISAANFDALVSDLHMPAAGDGLTVVSAMRHANPEAVTFILSAFPEMEAAATAILLQTDQILVKPVDPDSLVEAIKTRLSLGKPLPRVVETVATILERTTEISISSWLRRVHNEQELMLVPMRDELRCEHLPQLFEDLVLRLRAFKPLGTKELVSPSATAHGTGRRRQGYTAGMMVEESRLLQVSIFQTLQDNLGTIDFSVLLISVMSIADEVDSQLSQAMDGYMEESHRRDFGLI
jgi:DNA-binding NarL/FixJ family response regulator